MNNLTFKQEIDILKMRSSLIFIIHKKRLKRGKDLYAERHFVKFYKISEMLKLSVINGPD